MPRVQKPARPARSLAPKPRACRECNGHKIFCSKELPKCERCRLRSLECVYAGPTMIKVNEDTLRSLKKKLQAYKDLFASLPPDVQRSLPARPGTSGTAPDSNDGGNSDDGDDSESDENAAGDLSDDLKHIGLENQQSSDNFIRIVTKMSGLPADADDTDADGSSLVPNPVFYASGVLPSRRLLASRALPPPLLPPIDIARQYFAAQHMYIGTIFAFSDPATFDRQLRAAYASGPPSPADAAACLAYAKILMILALGRLYSVNRTGEGGDSANDPADSPPGLAYFSQGLALLPDLYDKGSLLGVETLAYAGYFLQNMNCRDAAYLYIGVALRMAITLGLHREGAPTAGDGPDDDAAREHRRRVWWSIYSLDRILSLKSGYPTSILDADIGVRMPARLPGEPVESPVAVLRCYTEMSRILGEIVALVYRRPAAPSASTGASASASPSPSASPVATVHAILQSLARWEAALPPHLRLDAGLSRESISVHLHCYQCVTITARPLLFQVAQRRLAVIREAHDKHGAGAAAAEKARPWQAGLARKTVAVIERCIAAARQTVRVMAQAAAHNMVATFGYMDGEYALSAAIVLTLVTGAFPPRPDTAAGLAQALALLRRIGGLGNRYVAARYAMLARLQALLASQSGEAAVVPDLAGGEDAGAEMAPWVDTSPWTDSSGVDTMPANTAPADPARTNTAQADTSTGTADATALPNPWYPDAFFYGPPGDTGDALVPALPEADSSLWTAAFANTAGLEFFQFLPETETDMTDYLGL